MSLGFVITASCSIILGFVTYYLWIWTYWIRRGVNGPRGKPFVGVLDVLLDHEKPGLLQLSEWTKKYGKVYGITDGTQKTLIVSDPSMVYGIFVKAECADNFYGRKLNPLQGNPETDQRVHMLAAQGGRWKRLRTISSASFSNASLRRMMGTVEDSALELLRHIEEKTAGGKPIDMLKFYQEYTMDVISRVAMGQRDTQMFKNPLVDLVRKVFCGDRKNILLFCQVFPTFGYMIRDLTFKFSGKIPAFTLYTVVRDAVFARIAQRQRELEMGAELGESQDFIDLFLDARSETKEMGLTEEEEEKEFSKRGMKVTRVLSTDEVVGQCFLFLIGGFDTTALALSYVTYCLATNPEVQKKVQEEVDREFGDKDVEFDKLGRLKYMDCVLKETLRLYPLAAISNARKCMRTTTVNGMEIEAGTYVQVDTWSLHYDTSVWGEDAMEFKPERWTTDNPLEHKGAYLPFGLGVRQCIGMRLAQMEQKVLLTHILKKYSFETGPMTSIPLKLVGSATTSPENVYVHLTSRHL
ncbi:CRE-CYP-13A2 protein [Caenorhabditis remanei]|uniref:CRE-CYP-13A2 protein n=1 Tax=Caenorhabditis remanei TaxID=31234 RepID=E3MZW5_CAERE|nr:CRE-CYP-13A2 protein [Caenorhabditis remanei]